MDTLHCIYILIVFLACGNMRPCTALFCSDWCREPYCECSGWGWIQFNSCHDFYSGHHCQCPFERTNIADHSYVVPNSLKGSLTLAKAADGTRNLLAGTWSGAYEYDPTTAAKGSIQFEAWADDRSENVWSVAKTAEGTELLGTPNGVLVRHPSSETTFRQAFDDPTIGAQGQFAMLGHRIFVGTFDGLYMSQDDGETWVKTPTDCAPYGDNLTSNATKPPLPDQDGEKPPLVPKPPAQSRYCDAPVTHVHVVDETTMIAFYMGYGGAHLIQFADDMVDSLVEESWQALPTFQDDVTCQGGFCHVLDATMHNDYLYVAFQSLSMARLNMNNPQSWQAVMLVDTNAAEDKKEENISVTAVRTVGDQLFAATSRGLYQSQDGTAWQLVSDEACRDRNKPPLLSLGMEHVEDRDGTNLLIIGTIYGPWVYRIP